jgi:hypothetical protein
MKMKSTAPPPSHECPELHHRIAINRNIYQAVIDKIAHYATFCNKPFYRAVVRGAAEHGGNQDHGVTGMGASLP